MDKKYTLTVESPQVVSDTVSSYNAGKVIEVYVPTTGRYTEEELAQKLSDYARTLVNQKPQLEPYTMEELNTRIDEAEAEIETGNVLPGTMVHAQMQDYINSLMS